MAQQPRLRTDVPGELLQKLRFGSQIFIEHVADVVSVGEAPGHAQGKLFRTIGAGVATTAMGSHSRAGRVGAQL